MSDSGNALGSLEAGRGGLIAAVTSVGTICSRSRNRCSPRTATIVRAALAVPSDT